MRSIPIAHLTLVALLLCGVAHAFTAEELAAKNAEAKGGLDKLHAITSLKRSGKLLVNGGQIELAYVETRKRPASIRYDATLQGLTVIQAYDGKEGWQINPFQGRKDPERMDADDTKALVEDADIDGPLVDWQAKGYHVDYLGTEDVDGTEAHKLRVTRPSGDIQYVYLDPDYFLEIRTISDRVVHGAHQETQTDYGDYEQVNGVYMSFAIESGPKGSLDTQKVQYDKVEANLAPDDALFHFPDVAAATAATAVK